MAHPSFKDLVEKLQKATQNERVPWQEADPSQGVAFVAEYDPYSITINAVARPDMGVDGKDYTITIRKKDSDHALESITAVALGHALGDPALGFSLMSDIFHRARRKALAIDDAMKKLLGDLTAQAGTDGAAAPTNGADTGAGPAVTPPDAAQTGDTMASPTIPAGTPAVPGSDSATP